MEQKKERDNVNHPPHYNQGKYEAIDVIEDWKLNFNLGNAIKYIARCRFKRNKIEDLEKAVWYIEREIKNTKKDISSEDEQEETEIVSCKRLIANTMFNMILMKKYIEEIERKED